MEADVGTLAHDHVEKPRRPEPRRAPPPPEFAGPVDQAKGRFERDRHRRDTVGLAEARAQHLVESVDAGEAIGTVAERLGISVEAADAGHAWASSYPNSPCRVTSSRRSAAAGRVGSAPGWSRPSAARTS